MQNIKKYISIIVISGALLLSAGFIAAETQSLDDLREDARVRAQQAMEQIKQLRLDAQNRISEIKSDLQKKIAEIKDQKKRDAATKIQDQLTHINQVWTDHFSNVLDKLDDILQKIKSRAQKAADNGQDMSQVNAAIQKATDAIAAARLSVANQAKKTYVANTTNLTGTTSTATGQDNLVKKLREQFKSLRDSLFTDLKSIRDGAMKDARSAVHDAFNALSKVPNVDKEPETSPNNQ